MLTRSQKIVIGIAVAVVVVAVASILLWYFLQHHGQNPPSTYKCVDGNKCIKCNPTEQCNFTTPNCNGLCKPPAPPPTYKCVDGNKCIKCNPTEQCNFTTPNCNGLCKSPSTFSSWECTTTGCTGLYDKSGSYKSSAACQANCSHKPPNPQSTCWLNTQDSLEVMNSSGTQIPASSITLEQVNEWLSAKDKDGNNLVYGQDMVVQCSQRKANSNDTWSQQFCKGDQLLVCQKTDKGPPYDKCQPFFSATGSKLTLQLDANNNITDRSQRSFSNLKDPTCKGTYYRGVCLDNTPTPPNWSQEERPYGVAFYHGGKTGLPEFNTRCAASYLKQIAAFSNEKNMNRTFLSVDAPLETKQNPYFLQPQFLVEHFLKNLNLTSKINNDPQPMEAGIIVYANPQDSSWNFQFDQQNNPFLKTCQDQWASDTDKSLFPVQDPSMCFNNPFYQSLLGGRIDTPDDPTTTCDKFAFTQLGSNPSCLQNCETSKCSQRIQAVGCNDVSDCDDWVGKNCMPYATQGTTSCTNNTCKLDCEGQCDACAEKVLCCAGKTCYCPNVASQVVAYVTAVNDTVDKLYPNGGCVKLTYIAYDGEDAKANKDAGGQCQFSAMVTQLSKQSIKVENIPKRLGWAFSMNATPFPQVNNSPNTSSFVMPEMYWYMGVNWPCVGSAQEYGQMTDIETNVPTCTTQIAYRDALENGKLTPIQFYQWMTNIQPCMTDITGAGSQGKFKSMRDNMATSPGQVWPMYSSESLSAQDKNKTNPSEWCLARTFNGGESQSKICGTADMLYSWSWEQIMQLLDVTYEDLYLNRFGNYDKSLVDGTYTPYLALYEAQFINPNWMNDKTFEASLVKACTPATMCQYCKDNNPVPCDSQHPCADGSNCARLTCPASQVTCNANGQAECPSMSSNSYTDVSSDPNCAPVCKGDCQCRYKNDQGKCPVCKTSSDCGTTKGNAIDCVPKASTQCYK